MGIVRSPDELERVIERQVAEGRAASPAAFLEQAILRLVDEACAEQEAIRWGVEAGAADIEAGRSIPVVTVEDGRRLQERWSARLRARLVADE